MSNKDKAQLISMRDVMLEAVEAQSTSDDAKEAKGAVSQHLMINAKRFVDGKTRKLDVELFLTACKQEEIYIKSDSAGSNKVDRIPACWQQAKSNIKQAAEFGLSPGDYKTESAMRKDLNQCRKDAKEQALENGAAEVDTQKLTVKSVDNEIRGVFAALADVYDSLDDEKALKMKQDLVGLHSRYKAVFDRIVRAEITKAKEPVQPARDNAGKVIALDDAELEVVSN